VNVAAGRFGCIVEVEEYVRSCLERRHGDKGGDFLLDFGLREGTQATFRRL
jgi:hypothetical protein